uniref:Uncharacterized protein n=1 Tax=Anopheles arabiensis TaxID=7173 RepID=A0A182I5D2_ANOAR
MTVTIFCGEYKPLLPDDYFGKFVKEMNRLQANGLKIGSFVYWVKLRAIIADAPARAFINKDLELNLSVDGIPLYNKSAEHLMQLYGISNEPSADVETFLRPLVKELNNLQDNGLMINNRMYRISIRAIIADSPTRAFIKRQKL